MDRDAQSPPPRTTAEEEAAEFVLELPSDLRVIEAAVTYLVNRLRSYAYAGSRLDLNFRVGVTEALSNAVLYGNRRDPTKNVHVEVSLNRTRVVVRVVDQGRGFDPGRVPDPTRGENLRRPGGRGLFLIHQLMDAVEYNECGNAVCLTLRRDEPRPRLSGTE